MSSKSNQKFEISYLRALLNSKLNNKKDEFQEKLVSDMITQDKLDLMALENITEHKKITELIDSLIEEIWDLYDVIHFLMSDLLAFGDTDVEDTVHATSFEECVSKMIKHEMETHPEMPQKQAIAVAYKKCRERFGKSGKGSEKK